MLAICLCFIEIFFFKQKTAYEMRISDWSSDACSSDLPIGDVRVEEGRVFGADDDVALVEPIEGAARRHAVNRGDHGLPAVHRLGAKSITGVLAVPDVVEFDDRLSDRKSVV